MQRDDEAPDGGATAPAPPQGREDRGVAEISAAEVRPEPVRPDDGLPDDAPTVGPRPRRRRRRWLRALAVALLAATTATAIVAWVALEPFLKELVLEEAARRGVRVEPREMSVTWGLVSLEGSRVWLDGVPDLQLSVEHVEIRLLGLRPMSVAARGVRGRARSADALGQLLAFGRLRQGELLPATAEDIELALAADGQPSVLDLRASDARLSGAEPVVVHGATLAVAHPRLPLGPFDLVVDAHGAAVDVGLGDDLASAKVRATADLDARKVELVIDRVRAAALAASLGRPVVPGAPPWPGTFEVGSTVRASWSTDPRVPLTGRVDATLYGLVPPHPPELAGIVFGKDTRASANFRAGGGATAVTLEAVEVSVGSLRLSGTGSVSPRGESFDARATLRGPIACAELVGSAAVARLGLPLGAGLGAIARQGLAGSVDLRLDIRVDGDRLASPEVRPSASLHCRLRLFGD